jgi:hypothetical protein
VSAINDRIEARLRVVGRDERYRSVVDALASSREVSGLRSVDLVRESLQLSCHVFGFGDVGRNRERAYLAAAVAASEHPYDLVDLPSGSDKAKHFFLSGYLSAWLGGRLSFLPGRLEERVAAALVVGVGWFKEVFDCFFGSGYSREDLQANVRGAWSPFQQIGGCDG